MSELILSLLLTCGPAIVSGIVLARALKTRLTSEIQPVALGALTGVLMVALCAAIAFLRGAFRSEPTPPPWQDPEPLSLAMQVILAPVGAALTIVAGMRGASKWMIISLLLSMAVLFVVGVLASASV